MNYANFFAIRGMTVLTIPAIHSDEGNNDDLQKAVDNRGITPWTNRGSSPFPGRRVGYPQKAIPFSANHTGWT